MAVDQMKDEVFTATVLRISRVDGVSGTFDCTGAGCGLELAALQVVVNWMRSRCWYHQYCYGGTASWWGTVQRLFGATPRCLGPRRIWGAAIRSSAHVESPSGHLEIEVISEYDVGAGNCRRNEEIEEREEDIINPNHAHDGWEEWICLSIWCISILHECAHPITKPISVTQLENSKIILAVARTWLGIFCAGDTLKHNQNCI
ncbi:hypothetical protein DFJ77DRAFT_436846 [Powellomyces hirtus]|nr:hypothetical protein DFJ77DRAFT_436846 [Powellomyces hirtus]